MKTAEPKTRDGTATYGSPCITIECTSKTRRKQEQKKIQLEFSSAGEDDVCSIQMDKITECSVEFLPENTPLFDKAPNVNKATIKECGHSFHAISLVYHFLRNSMACPVCRCGDINFPMSFKSFSNKNKTVKCCFKRAMKLQREEKVQEIEEQSRDLRVVFGTNLSDDLENIFQVVPTCAMFTFCDENDFSVPIIATHCPLRRVDYESGAVLPAAATLPLNPEEIVSFRTAFADSRRISSTLVANAAQSGPIFLHVTVRYTL
jgi:hypothetical protein